jgi:lysophospholipid acyltransferase (LPLAT)-like uncharacterized protein
VIYAFLHGQQLPLLNYPRARATAALVSRSRDGGLQARVLGRLGFGIVRGSSSSGGASALASCLEWLRSGRSLALAVDGPRGPAGASKPGVIFLAERTRAPIVPVACAASRGARLASAWDGFLLPAPFALTCIIAGRPYRPWEKDWTGERKLAYLDSLISDLSRRAGRAALGTWQDDGSREHGWPDRAAG